jgi:uncharacterized protein YbjQ (UPF0145 family)
VIGMRFDTSDISTNASELFAYGTAVLVRSHTTAAATPR